MGHGEPVGIRELPGFLPQLSLGCGWSGASKHAHGMCSLVRRKLRIRAEQAEAEVWKRVPETMNDLCVQCQKQTSFACPVRSLCFFVFRT